MNRFSALIKGSAVVTIGTLVSGVLSYAYSSLMGRMLGPADFGDLGAINAYFVLLTAVGGGLLTVTMYYTSSLSASGNLVGVARFYRKLIKIVFLASLVMTIIVVLTAPLVADFFSIKDSRSLAFALSSIVASLLLVVNRGVLQGSQKFGQLTISNILEYGIKLVVAYILVRAGLALGGATLAIPIAAISTFLITFLPLRQVLKVDSSKQQEATSHFPNKKEIALYFLPALASNALLLLLMNTDILLAKRYFEAEIAGQYIAVSTVAKIIFYITGPITSVMFPLIASQRSRGEKHYLTLVGSAIITVLGSMLILALYAVFDKEIVTALYGAQYQALSKYLPISAILVILLSLVNLMSQYFLSIQRYWFIAEMTVVSVIVLAYSLITATETIDSMLNRLVLGLSGLIVIMAVDYLIMKRRQISEIWHRND
jgi:O-antigen/teichoic acid export membrane protein